MRILTLDIDNFKRLGKVHIVANEHFNIIGGRNSQGKSSTLDAIISVLGGKKARPIYMLKDGEKEGSVKITFDGDPELHQSGITGELIFDDKGRQKLTITSDDGEEASSPQGIFDDLMGTVAFDPLRFSRLKGLPQVDELKRLVGLDFTEMDRVRDQAYRERTQVNTRGKNLKARLDGMMHHDDAPEQEVDVSDLMDEIVRRQIVNQQNQRFRQILADQELAEKHELLLIQTLDGQIAKLMEEMEAARAAQARIALRIAESRQIVSGLMDLSIEDVQEQIRSAGAINRKVAENAQYAISEVELADMREQSEGYTKAMQEIDQSKAHAIAKAPWPVEGLGFDSDGVTYNGLPFSQASTSQQLIVSTAIGMALNPRLKVLILREGSLLDDSSLEELSQYVKDQDYQLWIERVTPTEESEKGCTIVIEDGAVKWSAVSV